MKTILALSIAILTSHASLHAQSKLAYEKSDNLLKAGLGLGAPFSTGNVIMPPLQAIYEYGLTDDISIGAVLGYSSSSETYSSLGKIDYSYLIFGGRANYHFSTGERLDPYGGATLGYNKVSIADKGAGYFGDFAESSILYGVQLGANYYFNNKVGAWAELGYGIGYLNLGLVLKF